MIFKQHRVKSLIEKLLVIPVYEWPSDTDKFLLSVVQDEGIEHPLRLQAIELAGDLAVVNLELVEEFVKIAKDKNSDFELRLSAIAAMAPIMEEVVKPTYLETVRAIDPEEDIITADSLSEASKTLKEIFFSSNEPEELRRQALKSAVGIFDEWQVDAVKKAYDSKDLEWMISAVFCMRFLPNFEHEIMESFDYPNTEIQLYAVEAAGRHNLMLAWPKIEQILRYERSNIDLLCAAIYVAAKMNPDGMDDFIKLMPDDFEVQEAIAVVSNKASI
jgi:hypothetical protein